MSFVYLVDAVSANFVNTFTFLINDAGLSEYVWHFGYIGSGLSSRYSLHEKTAYTHKEVYIELNARFYKQSS